MNKIILIIASFFILSYESFSQIQTNGCCYFMPITQSGFTTFSQVGTTRVYNATICPGIPFSLSTICTRCSDCGPPFGNYATIYAWDFGDATPFAYGQNVTHTYASSGNYVITLTATGFIPPFNTPCTTTLIINVTVSLSSCAPCCIDPGTAVNGIGFKEFFYKSKNGNYFGSICPGKAWSLVSNCPGATSYNWNFGDGNTATGSSVSHSYNNPGTYLVTLIISGPSCYSKINIYITVSNIYCESCCTGPFLSISGVGLDPTVNPMVLTASVCPSTIFFNPNCSGASSYKWVWGDGNTSVTAGNVSHNYSIPGTYSIVITASGPFCAPSTMTIVLTVNTEYCDGCCTGPFVTSQSLQNFSQTGNPMIWLANACLGVQLNLGANCPNATGFTWNWGDNSPNSTGQFASHTYTTPGTYDITVTPTGPNCSSIAQTIILTVGSEFCPFCCTLPFVSGTGIKDITATGNPMIVLAGACPGTPLSLVANCQSATNYTWTWGDNSPNSFGQFASHTYLTPGTYDITVKPEGPGCSGVTQTFVLTVSNVYCDPCCPGQILNGQNFIEFNNTINPNVYTAKVCKDQAFSINTSFCQAATSYTWDFGVVPVTITNAGNVSYQFANAGTYNVVVTAGGDLCSLSQTITITVADCNCSGATIEPPTNGCVDYPVSLNVTGCLDPNATFNWNFGDGNTGTGNPGSHVYTSPGTYIISMTILQPPLPPTTFTSSIVITNCTTLNGCKDCIGSFSPPPGKYILSLWVKQLQPNSVSSYINTGARISFIGDPSVYGPFFPDVNKNKIIDGWQRIEERFIVPIGATSINIELINQSGVDSYYDDIRIFPVDGNMKSYVYDPITLRLSAELDENNYATFYEYDEEGKLIRVKKETEKGIMTIKEARNNTKKK